MSVAASSPTNNEVVPNVRPADEAPKARPQTNVPRLRPLADVYESEAAYKIELDLVSVNREEIAISVERNTLKVSAPRKGSPDSNGKSAAVYERDFTLPNGVDRESISATYTAGVLGVLIPKHEKERPRRVHVASN